MHRVHNCLAKYSKFFDSSRFSVLPFHKLVINMLGALRKMINKTAGRVGRPLCTEWGEYHVAHVLGCCAISGNCVRLVGSLIFIKR